MFLSFHILQLAIFLPFVTPDAWKSYPLGETFRIMKSTSWTNRRRVDPRTWTVIEDWRNNRWYNKESIEREDLYWITQSEVNEEQMKTE